VARTTELLLHSGAGIDELNTVRRHVSRLQGGQLAALLHPASVVTLILSDVIGDRLESIASGPTVPDPTTFADACEVLRRHGLWERVPDAVRSHILSGIASKVPETPKPSSRIFETSQAFLLGNNDTAIRLAAAAAQARGFDVHVLAQPLIGEARDIGAQLAARAVTIAGTATAKWALVAGGETTVTVCGDGLGGRNQEVALAAALQLEGIRGISLAALATDGTDGTTDVAGALIDGETAGRARELGIDPGTAMARNDSHPLLAATEDLLWTGPTRTNVADLALILGEP
jgi:glycerate-2-kinase